VYSNCIICYVRINNSNTSEHLSVTLILNPCYIEATCLLVLWHLNERMFCRRHKEDQVTAGLIESFLMWTLQIQMHSHMADLRDSGSKGRERIKRQRVVEAQPSTATSSRKQRKMNSEPVSFLSSAASPRSLLPPLKLTQPNLRIAHVCVYESLLRRFDLGPFHQHRFPLKTTFSPRRKERETKITPLGSEIALSHKKGVIIEINHPILFHN